MPTIMDRPRYEPVRHSAPPELFVDERSLTETLMNAPYRIDVRKHNIFIILYSTNIKTYARHMRLMGCGDNIPLLCL